MNDFRKLPIFLGIAAAIGFFIGSKFYGKSASIGEDSKIKNVLNAIENNYVDAVNTDTLINASIDGMLKNLDPHSVFLPPTDAKLAQSQLNNGFDGIGVEFNIFKDTVYVVAPLAGGPSEAAGILTGDAILTANGKAVSKKDVDSPHVFGLLRGQKGTDVSLEIFRKSIKKKLLIKLKRDAILSPSVDAFYMIDATKGYIRVNRFGENTAQEFQDALISLKSKGLKQLVLDLRGNPGGYMEQATEMLDQLIAGTGKLVYTDGQNDRFDRTINAGVKGIFEKEKIVVLIDESSASASEIMAGAIQDYDRGAIIGRRSFGKGLVQQPISLADGSELRLTIARYYIPSGRSIQKKYEKGHGLDYELEYYTRQSSAEMFNKDSIKIDKSKVFKTASGRAVYGGGGILPDIFIKKDTSFFTPYLAELFGQSILRTYCMTYSNQHLAALKNTDQQTFIKNYQVKDQDFDALTAFARKNGLKPSQRELNASKSYIKTYIKAQLARQIWRSKKGDDHMYFACLNAGDPYLEAAIRELNSPTIVK